MAKRSNSKGKSKAPPITDEPLFVVLSWSKPISRAIAEVLHRKLPELFRKRIKVWISSRTIDLGKPWPQAVWNAMRGSNFGILCVTTDNAREPWLHFEAGLLCKSDHSQVIPYIHGLSRIEHPLGFLQDVKAEREGTERLVTEINTALGRRGIEAAKLERDFEKWWPEFKKSLDEAVAKAREQVALKRKQGVCQFIEEFTRDCEPPLNPVDDRQTLDIDRSYRLLVYMFDNAEFEKFIALDLAIYRWMELKDDREAQVLNKSRDIQRAIEGMIRNGRCKDFRRIFVINDEHARDPAVAEIFDEIRRHQRRLRSKQAKDGPVIETRYFLFDRSSHSRDISSMKDFVLFDHDGASFAVVEENLRSPSMQKRRENQNIEHTIRLSDEALQVRRDGFDRVWADSLPLDHLTRNGNHRSKGSGGSRRI
jgi:hypothetical protein